MEGRLVLSSDLIQTTTSLTFYLSPTLELSTKSYLTIEIPKDLDFEKLPPTTSDDHRSTIDFESRGCTVKESDGFTDAPNCLRRYHTMTIRKLFTSPYDPKYAG